MTLVSYERTTKLYEDKFKRNFCSLVSHDSTWYNCSSDRMNSGRTYFTCTAYCIRMENGLQCSLGYTWLTHRVFEVTHIGGDHLERARIRQGQALLVVSWNPVVAQRATPQATRRHYATTGCIRKRIPESVRCAPSDTVVVVDSPAGKAAEASYRETSSWRMYDERNDLNRT